MTGFPSTSAWARRFEVLDERNLTTLAQTTDGKSAKHTEHIMATPLIAGMAVAGAAMASRYMLITWRTVMARQGAAGAVRFPRALAGGFESEMSRKEAFQILSLRENSTKEQIREAHRKLMRLNHPDNGGSTYVATKVNEAKDCLLGGKRGGRVF